MSCWIVVWLLSCGLAWLSGCIALMLCKWCAQLAGLLHTCLAVWLHGRLGVGMHGSIDGQIVGCRTLFLRLVGSLALWLRVRLTGVFSLYVPSWLYDWLAV